MNATQATAASIGSVILLVCVSLGCSTETPIDPTTAIAIGLATLDGAPITGGMITIISDENASRRATGILRPDGTFRLASAPVGKCRVVIDTTSVQMGDPAKYMPLPVKYHAPQTTDLSIELQPGKNEQIELRAVTK